MTAEKPRLLDLFCGAGGAAMGYHRAGFDVVGVDVNPQPRYPFEFHQADAMRVLSDLQLAGVDRVLGEFDAIHASPPCQGYSRMRHLPWLKDREYPMLIEPIRAMLVAIGKPYVIENVAGAPLDPAAETVTALWQAAHVGAGHVSCSKEEATLVRNGYGVPTWMRDGRRP